jgi:putative tryptophan/tyrosine transport system substrate-binding protein
MLSSLGLDKSIYARALVESLARLGYREGSGMKLEFRSLDAQAAKDAARELVQSKCDLIFAIGGEPPARSLRDQKSDIPIVFLAADYDPLERGLITGLGRPGGNITGVVMPARELTAKRLEILREVLPQAKTLAVLIEPSSRNQLPAVEAAARRNGVVLVIGEFPAPPHDFDAVLASVRKSGADGIVVPAAAMFSANVGHIASMAVKHRLPAIGFTGSAERGFLMTYSIDSAKAVARAAEMGVKILRGAKPADIPVEQPAEFVLVVNLRVAKALGVTLPPAVVARATKLIQ